MQGDKVQTRMLPQVAQVTPAGKQTVTLYGTFAINPVIVVELPTIKI